MALNDFLITATMFFFLFTMFYIVKTVSDSDTKISHSN